MSPRRSDERRILLIAPQPFYEPRGTPMNVLQMCKVLTAAGYAVDLATYPIGEPVDIPGLTVHRAPRIPGIRSVPIGFSKRKLLLDVSLVLLVTWLLLRRSYRVVHAVEEAVFLALPFTWLGVPLIYDLDSLISHQLEYAGVLGKGRLLDAVRWLERLALSRSCAAITVCRALTDSARALQTDTPVFQIEDTPLEGSLRDPDAEQVEALRREFDLCGRPVVVYTGNLESYQGIDLLLDAAALLREREPRLVIVLVGGTREQVRTLEARLGERGLAECVRAVGARPPAEMPEWMAIGEALVSPRCEGANTPLKIYTYMGSGKPIVATDLETHTQALDRESAVLCEPTARGLSEGLARVVRDPKGHRALARAARERVEREFGFEAFRRKLLAAYEAVTSGA